ncbi:hypothetical protein F4801DRAFT_604981, partial [Xylaria longipes]
VEERSRSVAGRFNLIHLVISPQPKHAPYRIKSPSHSSKYTIISRFSAPWGSLSPVHSMPPHSHHQDRSMVSPKGKGRESVVATWPPPSDPNLVSPRKPTQRPKLSQSIFTQPQTTQRSSQTLNNIPLAEGNHHDGNHSSNTWTSSSENPDLPSEDGREHFILEYNRLAQRHGIRPIVPGDFSPLAGHPNNSLGSRRGSWLSKMLRQDSEQSEQAATKSDSSRHQRRPSDIALDFVHGNKRDRLKNQDLRALVRLCGKSTLFLPTDYAPFSLTLPTCLRALAQALVQHADTKGIFRVCGSARVVNALYDYYCTDDNTEAISSTTRCPTLPSHIRCNPHDIASTFKRFLAGLPGGILGSLSLFDALVAIRSQLQGDPEWHWTKESKLRARLIALAIGTVKSQYQRELICAVFGLLCLVGRVAENAPREDESGRPLPTGDLMGYNSLGIVFGPLLIGDMINDYSMKVANPSAGLVLLPISAPRSRKETRKYKRERKAERERKSERKRAKRPTPSAASSLVVDKVHVTNSITEMLIVHWREVVRQIRNTGSVRTKRSASNPQRPGNVPINISSSVSENFNIKNPPHWDHARRRSASPSTASLTATPRTGSTSTVDKHDNSVGQWTPHAQQASISSSGSTQKPSTKAPPHPLSPTIEESPSPQVEASKLSRGHQKTTSNVGSDLTQKAYPISPGTSRSSARKPETPSPSQSAVQQNKIHIIPYSETELSGSDEARNKTSIEATSSANIKIDPPSSCSNSPTRVQNNTDYEGDTLTRNPADQWRSLVASSKASTESLAKSAKERRLKRSFGNTPSRSSRESSSLAGPKPTTPEWKQRAAQERSEQKGKSTAVWPERKILPEETPHSIHPTLKARVERFSPGKYSSDTPQRASSRRSTSKPVPGAVKAMAALFDHAAKESPDKPAALLSGRTRNTPRGSSSSPYRDAMDGSPTKSHPPGDARSLMKYPDRLDEDPYQRRPTETPFLDRHSLTPEGPSTVRASPSRLTTEDTPTRPLRDTLQPVETFSSPRKEPQPSPAREIDHRSQPPKLGAMVPHQEEPAVGHFMRPSSSTSTQSRTAAGADPPLDPRHTSGASFLHAQIRSLQRQLETKNEEITQLRRRLETQEHMDIGTLCEQLRLAKRECMMWRKRAEAAERRVAVFQRFGSRFQALTDGVVDDGDNGIDGLGGRSPSCSVRTENGEVFDNRLRRGFAGKMRLGEPDGTVFDDGIDDVGGAGRGYELRPRRTVELWDAAQELLDFRHGGSMHV